MFHNKPLISSYYLVLAFILVFQVAHVLLKTNSQVQTGITLQEMNQELTDLEDTKKQLTAKLASQVSLTTAYAEATEAGFVPISQPIVLSKGSTVAQSNL